MTSATFLKQRKMAGTALAARAVVMEGVAQSQQLVAQSSRRFGRRARAATVNLVSALVLLVPLLLLVIAVFMMLHADLALIFKLLPILGFTIVVMPLVGYVSSAAYRKDMP